ncbi:hypothetical protein PN419_17985 [Halorubrum ezzemoulense]|uniref:hypothetical protein n=1 Tax=Halorubrum ezzemoulense TaxID=337243 RepID=UPI002330685F|nr:hypothetical protein [Halorubrum ezzemoulense]MDB9250861.1 hypothetical protein [Halorubrum ezzemoulense]MDB9261034.1 hypothetical protein [Halorubrum ezzemoulense]MDB9264424.1 hypothetical protein [Halorubrum ezzemoulense]MDB9267913.1 hypothetical protein [Halorubrum ezzemoulense]MDB9271395.1 hypothetical protein [Halorubrum ezzemoulense]
MSDEDTQSEADEEEPDVKATDADSDLNPSRSAYAITDRERAMLTKTDRELLLGEKEYKSDQALRNARHRVREHIRNSLLDAFTVSTLIKTDELEQIVERHFELSEQDGYPATTLSSGVLGLAMRLMYIEATQEFDTSFTGYVESKVATEFRSVIQQETDTAVSEIDVDIDVTEREDIDEAVRDIVHGNTSMTIVLDHLANAGPEKLQNALRENDTVIETSGGIVIGPDHEIFDSLDWEKLRENR